MRDMPAEYMLDGHKEFLKLSPKGTMPLTRFERKERLRYGEQKEIAAEVGLSIAFVSRVQNDKVEGLDPETVRRVRVAIARRLRPRTTVADAFAESAVA